VLPTLRKYASIIQAYKITRFEQVGSSFRLRAQLEFIDGSLLYLRETVLEGIERKYSYHWQNADGNLLIRWDNAPDWEIETFPHHKHVGSQQNVVASYERTLEQVLAVIKNEIGAS
jgi:hypothetical protein